MIFPHGIFILVFTKIQIYVNQIVVNFDMNLIVFDKKLKLGIKNIMMKFMYYN